MLTKKQLRQMHAEDVPLHILELDYIQSIVLKHIFMRHEGIVFKGGTCLRKVHGLNRFSEDLDFNIIHDRPEQLLKEGVRGLDRTGIDAEITHQDDREDVFLAKIRYQGPLYSGTDISKGTLKIDMSKHEVHNEASWTTIVEDHADVGTYSTMTMDKEEILAEKFRSLVQRNMPRDLYDIWFLFKKESKLDEALVRTKFEDLDMEPRSPSDIIEDHDITDEEWKKDLEDLMNRPPDRDKLLDDIEETVNK